MLNAKHFSSYFLISGAAKRRVSATTAATGTISQDTEVELHDTGRSGLGERNNAGTLCTI